MALDQKKVWLSRLPHDIGKWELWDCLALGHGVEGIKDIYHAARGFGRNASAIIDFGEVSLSTAAIAQLNGVVVAGLGDTPLLANFALAPKPKPLPVAKADALTSAVAASHRPSAPTMQPSQDAWSQYCLTGKGSAPPPLSEEVIPPWREPKPGPRVPKSPPGLPPGRTHVTPIPVAHQPKSPPGLPPAHRPAPPSPTPVRALDLARATWPAPPTPPLNMDSLISAVEDRLGDDAVRRCIMPAATKLAEMRKQLEQSIAKAALIRKTSSSWLMFSRTG